MPKIKYADKKFGADATNTLRLVNRIINEYAAQGFDLTLRQLHYQMVARGYQPNTMRDYKRLGDIVSDGRMAGLIDWDRIVDRTRSFHTLPHWDDPADIIASAAQSFNLDKWAKQPLRCEVWMEKDALIGVLEGVCEENDLTFFAARGYNSSSAQWAASQRLEQYIEAGQRVIIFHLGDHDPSGIDMTRDLEERMQVFLRRDWIRKRRPVYLEWAKDHGYDPEGDADKAVKEWLAAGERPWDTMFEIQRLALNWDQVQQYNPPPNPAKATDTRFRNYQQQFGDESWELDALDPTVLAALITTAVDAVRDEEEWVRVSEVQDRSRDLLTKAAQRWHELEGVLAAG